MEAREFYGCFYLRGAGVPETAQGEKMGDEMRFSFEELRRENQQFGGDFNQETHNREKPISQKTTHLLLYGGLGVVALWIILNEILHF